MFSVFEKWLNIKSKWPDMWLDIRPDMWLDINSNVNSSDFRRVQEFSVSLNDLISMQTLIQMTFIRVNKFSAYFFNDLIYIQMWIQVTLL